MRLAWATDIHLDHASPETYDAFLRALDAAAADAVVVTGDIGAAGSVEGYVERLAERVGRPVHFVLGNHDFYDGRIEKVRTAMRELTRRSSRTGWLPESGIVPLTPRTGLVGHDGWADGRLGVGAATRVIMNDSLLIEDFAELLVGPTAGLDRGTPDWMDRYWGLQEERFVLLARLGDEAAAHVRAVLPAALERFERVIVATHVPPFREAAWHKGRPSTEEWLPHSTCHAVGEALREAARARPDRRITVLCGHTHGGGHAEIAPNLEVHTGSASYGRPAVASVLDLE
jgi:3',5'-cyclic-AMP phosphodiesterase